VRLAGKKVSNSVWPKPFMSFAPRRGGGGFHGDSGEWGLKVELSLERKTGEGGGKENLLKQRGVTKKMGPRTQKIAGRAHLQNRIEIDSSETEEKDCGRITNGGFGTFFKRVSRKKMERKKEGKNQRNG